MMAMLRIDAVPFGMGRFRRGVLFYVSGCAGQSANARVERQEPETWKYWEKADRACNRILTFPSSTHNGLPLHWVEPKTKHAAVYACGLPFAYRCNSVVPPNSYKELQCREEYLSRLAEFCSLRAP